MHLHVIGFESDVNRTIQLDASLQIQAHGGIGFTWEHVLHRLYKRALGIQSWEASTAQLRSEVAAHLLEGGGR